MTESLPNNRMSERFRNAYAKMLEADGENIWRLHKQYEDFPDLARFICEFYFNEVGSRRVLTPRMREAIVIGALLAKGTFADPLASHMVSGYKAGLSLPELRELVLLTLGYTGAPNGSTGGRRALAAVEELVEKETGSPVDKEATYPDLQGKERAEHGCELLKAGGGQQADRFLEKYTQHTTLMDLFVSYIYGDLHARTVLDEQTKAMAVLSIINAVGRSKDMLCLQVQTAVNAGCSREMLEEACLLHAAYLGFVNAFTLAEAIDTVLTAQD